MSTDPGLELVREFVNSYDLEDGSDALGTPDGAARWFGERSLLEEGALTDAERAQAVEVREALRALLMANAGEPHDPDALVRLNVAASSTPLVVLFHPDGNGHLTPPEGGVSGALGRILAEVYTAMSTGTWSRLKVCRRDDCRWAFYDASRNHSRSWCSMAVCGNREKASLYRARQRDDSSNAGDAG